MRATDRRAALRDGVPARLFRDPDGNLVNLFTPVSKEAIKKFSRTDDLRAESPAVENAAS